MTGVKVVGITGSVGKTTTKEMIASVLSRDFKLYKSEGNHNNEIGLPMTVMNMPEDTELWLPRWARTIRARLLT